MATIFASLAMGFNLSFIMEIAEVSFVIGVASLAVFLLVLEVLRKVFPKRKYWSIFNCLLLAILLGICAGEIYHATVFKVIVLDTIIIALITAGVSIYQNVMERKDDLEYEKEEGQEAAKEKPKKVAEIRAHNEGSEGQQTEKSKEQQDFDMPSPEVIANLVRNLTDDRVKL